MFQPDYCIWLYVKIDQLSATICYHNAILGRGGGGVGVQTHRPPPHIAGQIISKLYSFSPETELTPLTFA